MITRWMLGRYVQATALLQFAIYTMVVVDDDNVILLLLDPRVAVTAGAELLMGWRGYPPAIAWLSAVVFLGLGEAVVRRRSGLIVYAVVQTAYIALFAIVANRYVSEHLRVTGGQYAGEWRAPAIVFAVASIVPLLVSVWTWRMPGAQPKGAVA